MIQNKVSMCSRLWFSVPGLEDPASLALKRSDALSLEPCECLKSLAVRIQSETRQQAPAPRPRMIGPHQPGRIQCCHPAPRSDHARSRSLLNRFLSARFCVSPFRGARFWNPTPATSPTFAPSEILALDSLDVHLPLSPLQREKYRNGNSSTLHINSGNASNTCAANRLRFRIWKSCSKWHHRLYLFPPFSWWWHCLVYSDINPEVSMGFTPNNLGGPKASRNSNCINNPLLGLARLIPRPRLGLTGTLTHSCFGRFTFSKYKHNNQK